MYAVLDAVTFERHKKAGSNSMARLTAKRGKGYPSDRGNAVDLYAQEAA
jgi:hypothetical protein